MSIRDDIQIWLADIAEHGNISTEDREELESHLLDSVDGLMKAGLREDEAYLIALRRMGDRRELMNIRWERRVSALWKTLNSRQGGDDSDRVRHRKEQLLTVLVFLGTALTAILVAQIGDITRDVQRYALNVSMLVLPYAALYYVGRRWIGGAPPAARMIPSAVLLLLPLLVNFFPFANMGQTALLSILHLPLAGWLAFSLFRDDHILSGVEGRMDFIRFSGEVFVYSVLVGLSEALLLGISGGLFSIVGVRVSDFAARFVFPLVLPVALMTGIVLTERKRSIVENFAPVLANILAPALLVVLGIFTPVLAVQGSALDIDREALILLDALLLLVIAVVIYSVSAGIGVTENRAAAVAHLALVGMAMLSDIYALTVMMVRLSQFGASPNKVAALGANILLLGNLGLLLFFFIGKLSRRGQAGELLSLQGWYFIVYYIWLLIVGLGFPLFFHFV